MGKVCVALLVLALSTSVAWACDPDNQGIYTVTPTIAWDVAWADILSRKVTAFDVTVCEESDPDDFSCHTRRYRCWVKLVDGDEYYTCPGTDTGKYNSDGLCAREAGETCIDIAIQRYAHIETGQTTYTFVRSVGGSEDGNSDWAGPVIVCWPRLWNLEELP